MDTNLAILVGMLIVVVGIALAIYFNGQREEAAPMVDSMAITGGFNPLNANWVRICGVAANGSRFVAEARQTPDFQPQHNQGRRAQAVDGDGAQAAGVQRVVNGN